MEFTLCEWSDKLCFGIERMDAQHKQLFSLAASFAGDGNQIRMMKTLALLGTYVRQHFEEEEALLRACAYPRLDEHCRAHRRFRRMFAKLLHDAKAISLDEIAIRVQYLINGWFYNHIMVSDLDYAAQVAAYLHSADTGQTEALARKQAAPFELRLPTDTEEQL